MDLKRLLTVLAIYAVIIIVCVVIFENFGQLILGAVIGAALVIMLWFVKGKDYVMV